MIKPQIKFSFILLFFAFSNIFAAPDHEVNNCDDFNFYKINGFILQKCEAIKSTIIEKYQENNTTAIYSSEFDQRIIFIAHSVVISDLKEISGIGYNSKKWLEKTHLHFPPYSDRINKIEIGKNEKYKNWMIETKIISYKNQGDRPGFLLQCATAIRSTGGNSLVLAECFPFEERERFIKTLDELK